ncbi:TetR/AcrR family transcriptional regulator [Halobacillus ihumii]|uniref:TetR/AcrR family transcriptional regulator n=1 Tax=Halobacillus ihumii TaxID=2686092 RepID=UPI0013D37570|nr:TetR/AcrR family transcriptional regulator [Halobacillus ihumii]
MPKFIDHKKRKIQIAEATWRVIVEEGLEHATVRKIAAAAGLSVGSLRHYFASQSELFLFSMELVSERVKQRIEAKNYEGSSKDMLTTFICEFLPVDEERRIEMEVWFVFSAKTLVDPKLSSLSEKVYNEMHEGLATVIYSLPSNRFANDNLDLETEVDRLHTLVDGLALHHMLHPSAFPYDKMIRTLQYHLQSICKM